MTRAVFAMMAGLLCALAGVRHAASLKGDAIRLNRWTYLLRHFSLLLKEGSLSIPEALTAAADQSGPADQLLHSLARQIRAHPLQTLAEALDACPGCALEHALLSRLLTRIGHGTKESRCLAVDQAAEEMALLAKSAAEKAEKDARLWQTLGFAGGACLTILLL